MRCLLLLAALLLPFGSVSAAGKILLVLTNCGEIGETGQPTGFFLSEAAHPWVVFTEAGYEVDLASPEGGFAPVDPKSLKLDDRKNARFWEKYGEETAAGKGVADTRALATTDPKAYAAIFFAGGHGTMWDFPNADAVSATTAAVYEQGGVVAAVCHGPAALVGVELSDGTPLVKGRKVAAFTDSEERAVQLADAMPFLLESKLRELGADVSAAPNFEQNAIADGRLVTGQNPASAEAAARLVVQTLKGQE